LLDICLAGEAVREFTADTPDFMAYQASHKTRSAVERQLASVGEAVNPFRRECPAAILQNTRQMVDFRNRLIHSYNNVNDTIVLVIIKQHLPVLNTEVMALLQAEE